VAHRRDRAGNRTVLVDRAGDGAGKARVRVGEGRRDVLSMTPVHAAWFPPPGLLLEVPTALHASFRAPPVALPVIVIASVKAA
jgi:hypothetical protein